MAAAAMPAQLLKVCLSRRLTAPSPCGQPAAGYLSPSQGLRLAGKGDAGAGVKLFDAVVGEVLFEAQDEGVSEEAGGGDAAGLELV